MKTYKDWICRYYSEHEDDEEDGVIIQELIRCKDCRHFYQSRKQRDLRVCDHARGCIDPDAEGFCSNAEPKRHK